MCVCIPVYVHVHACVRACVRACACVCVCVRAPAHPPEHNLVPGANKLLCETPARERLTGLEGKWEENLQFPPRKKMDL